MEEHIMKKYNKPAIEIVKISPRHTMLAGSEVGINNTAVNANLAESRRGSDVWDDEE